MKKLVATVAGLVLSFASQFALAQPAAASYQRSLKELNTWWTAADQVAKATDNDEVKQLLVEARARAVISEPVNNTDVREIMGKEKDRARSIYFLVLSQKDAKYGVFWENANNEKFLAMMAILSNKAIVVIKGGNRVTDNWKGLQFIVGIRSIIEIEKIHPDLRSKQILASIHTSSMALLHQLIIKMKGQQYQQFLAERVTFVEQLSKGKTSTVPVVALRNYDLKGMKQLFGPALSDAEEIFRQQIIHEHTLLLKEVPRDRRTPRLGGTA